MRIVESNSEVTMLVRSRKHIRWGVATAVIALGLSGIPMSLDVDALAFGAKAAFAGAGGSGKGKGNGHGHDKGVGTDQSQQAKLTNGHLAKTDPMHPSNLGRLNGFLHASPQALVNASANSAIGILSKSYAEALAGYLATGDTTTTTTTTVTEDDLAAILAKAANKPLTGEQIIAINEKLMAVDPELAALGETTVTNTDGTTTTTNSLTDPALADALAEEANAIQDTETNQGLGSGDDAADDGATDDGDVADGGDSEDSDGVVAAAADSVTQAAEDTADAVGDFIDDTF
jgi:hypothetical protein